MKKQIVFMFLLSLCFSIQSWPPALYNCEATCFLNASIQAFYNIRSLSDLLVQNPNPYSQSESPVGYYYVELIKKFKATQNPDSPVDFTCERGIGLKELDDESYKLIRGCNQEDASEFMGAFIDTLIEKNTNTLLKSQIRALLQFDTISKITCPALPTSQDQREHQEYISKTKEEDHTYLSIETQNKQKQPFKTLRICLSEYFKVEKLVDPDDAYKDPRTNKYRIDCSKQLVMGSSPEILIIALKRYEFITPAYSKKLDHRIYIPLELNMANFVIDGNRNIPSHQYKLIGVVVHRGGPGGGHYWAYVKDDSGQWYYCNDSSINKVSIDEPAVIAEIEGSGKNRPTGYGLFYQKKAITPSEFNKWQKQEVQREYKALGIDPLADLKKELERLTNSLQVLNKELEKFGETSKQ